jgi:carbon-monoxide dehydrogenase medium subunit
LAGGTVLVPEVSASGGGPDLVDIGGLGALRGITSDRDALIVGAGVTLAALERATIAPPALRAAAAAIGNPHVRHAGTVGGNVAFRMPYANLPPLLIALGANVVLAAPGSEGLVAIDRIATEGVPQRHLITAVRVPIESERRAGFRKFEWRRSSGRTLVTVAASAVVVDGAAHAPRVAVGGICKHARRLPRTEAFLEGRTLDERTLEEASRLALDEVVSDVSEPPSETYRRRLVAAGVSSTLREIAA